MQTTKSAQNILVVEDEWLIALDIRMMIEDEGHNVVGPAKSVDKALILIDGNLIDAAFLDVTLGIENSFPIGRLLNTKGVPLTFLTAYGKADIPEEFHKCDLLSKPIAPQVFNQQLRKMLSAD